MNVISTPVTNTDNTIHHVLEFNISLPTLACRSVAPISSIELSERFVIPYTDEAQGGTPMKLVKLNVVHRIAYSDTNNVVRFYTTQHSVVLHLPSSGNNPDTTYYHTQKLADVIVPASSKVTQSTIANPTDTTGSNGKTNRCAYSIFKLTTSNTQLPAVPSAD